LLLLFKVRQARLNHRFFRATATALWKDEQCCGAGEKRLSVVPLDPIPVEQSVEPFLQLA